MSKYLNDLIKSLQAEAKEYEAGLNDQAAPTARGFRRDSSYLDRLLQRIKTLEDRQLSEAKRNRQLFRGAFANDRPRVSSPDVARRQENASRQ